MVDPAPSDSLPPWLQPVLRSALDSQRGHALLLQGPAGAGQFDLAVALAQAWLCDALSSQRPCGHCASCRLTQSHTHPDLLVLLPEASRDALGWGWSADDAASDTAPPADKASKRKPSKDIRIDEVRLAVAFAQSTSARGRGKVVVLSPAERLNLPAANALLKTLEEPPGDARLVLCTAAAGLLLPTLRSRCQSLTLALPQAIEAQHWLAAHSVDQPAVLLAAAGGQPQEALAWSREGIGAEWWLTLPRRLAHGDSTLFAGWALPRVVAVLQKLCHDLMRLAVRADPVYFPRAALPTGASMARLARWSADLAQVSRQAEHPWNASLMLETLAADAERALAS